MERQKKIKKKLLLFFVYLFLYVSINGVLLQKVLKLSSVTCTMELSESGFLFIKPLSTSYFDFVNVLSPLISVELHQNPKDFAFNLKQLNDLRVETLSNPSTITFELITKLKKYQTLLPYVKTHFPNLMFEWENQLVDFNKELQNINYNLSAYYSILATSLISSNLKRSAIYFQYSASLNDQFMNILLGQAQEIYYQTALSNSFKDSLITKITIQVADFYDQRETEGIWSYVYLKYVYFRCLSYLKYSLNCKDKGVAKACLQECQNLYSSIGDIQDVEFAQLSQDLENIKLKVINRFDEMEDVDVGKLGELKRCILAKPIEPPDLEVEAPFQKLIPKNIVEKLLVYEKTFDEFIQNELMTPLVELNIDLNVSNIEYELEKITGKFVPEIILQYRDQLIELGGIEKLDNLWNTLTFLKNECRLKLDNIWILLKNQTQYEETLALEHGYENWKLEILENNQQAGPIINSFKIYENYIKQAENGDNLINIQINEIRPFISIFHKMPILKEYIPDAEYIDMNPQLKDVVQSLRKCIEDIKSLVEERNKFTAQLKHKAKRFDAFQKYQKGEDLNSLLKNEIMTYSKEIEFVDNSKQKQLNMIETLNEQTVQFSRIKTSLKVSAKRIETINVLKASFEGFLETLKNAKQGVEFYQNLLENIKSKTSQLDIFLSKRIGLVKSIRNSV